MVADRKIIDEIIEISRSLAGDSAPLRLCFYGSRVSGYAREKSDYNALLLLEQYPEGIRYYYRELRDAQAAFLIADKELFDMDTNFGSLGEFLAGRLLSPYIPLSGYGYFRNMEVVLKKRVCLEEFEELVLANGELSRGLLFKPEYVALSRMKRRLKAYPPLRYSYSKLLSGKLKDRNLKRIMPGFIKALKILEKEEILFFDGELVRLSDGFIDKLLSRRNRKRVINVLENSRRAIHSYLTQGRAGRVNLDSVSKELTAKLTRGLLIFPERIGFEDPKKFLYLKTAQGLLNMEERRSALEAVGGFRSDLEVKLNPLGGALNEVFLAEAEEDKFVVKRFSDWFGFKWFTLNIVALGTKIFSISGKERLSNEYGMTCYMADKGLPIQRILYVSTKEKTLIKEYIEGVNYSKIVKEAKADALESLEKDFRSIGVFMGKIHSMDVTLGDTKPENILRQSDGVVSVDLEQASKGGDKSWDVAEFLYYLGHYRLTVNDAVRTILDSFIDGYLSEGTPPTLRKAAGLNYIKVFSFWTPALIIQLIASKLKKAS